MRLSRILFFYVFGVLAIGVLVPWNDKSLAEALDKGAKGAAGTPGVSPQSFAASIAGGFKAACPGTFAVKGLGEAKFGDHDAFVAVAGCGRVEGSPDKHSETALIAVVKGSSDYYTLQWAERSAPVDTPGIDDAKWQQRIGLLQPIRLCPIVPGEAAPYPSCAGKN